MAKIFCVAQSKGRRRQDHTTVNLAAGLAKVDSACLMIDLDRKATPPWALAWTNASWP